MLRKPKPHSTNDSSESDNEENSISEEEDDVEIKDAKAKKIKKKKKPNKSKKKKKTKKKIPKKKPDKKSESEEQKSDASESSDEEEETEESSDDESEASEEEESRARRRKKKRHHKKDTKPSVPPLPINGNRYFLMMLVCQFFTVAWLFWAFWIMNSGLNYAVMIALNCVVIALEIFGYRAVIYEKFKDFAGLWRDRKQPAERKMNSIITVTTTNTALMFVMFLIQGVTVITIFFAVPSVVLQTQVWNSVTSMPPANQAIFTLLIMFAAFTFYFVWCLTYALLYAVNRGCVLLEANNYDRLIGETYRIALSKHNHNVAVVNNAVKVAIPPTVVPASAAGIQRTILPQQQAMIAATVAKQATR